MGKEQRFGSGKKAEPFSPGPGNYEIDKDPNHTSPNYAIGKGKRTDITGGKSTNPGPGQYESNDTKHNKGWSFGLKTQ